MLSAHKGDPMSINVLLADDQMLARMGIRVLLEDAQDISIVGEAASGREAAALARELRPDVVLMDLKMGDGDGVEATQTIRQECPATRVLILSSYGDSNLLRRTATVGAAGYVLKDVSSVELIGAIRSVHQGKTTIAPDIARQLLDDLANSTSGGESVRRGPHGLTQRDTEVLAEVARGLGDKEIAAKLFLSESTVKSHLRTVYRRLRLRNRAHAAAFAIERNLVDAAPIDLGADRQSPEPSAGRGSPTDQTERSGAGALPTFARIPRPSF